MIRFRLFKKGQSDYQEFFILENEEEWLRYSKKHKTKLTGLDICEKGDYIFLDNGYCVPVVGTSQYNFGHIVNNRGTVRHIRLPNITIRVQIYPDGKFNRKHILSNLLYSLYHLIPLS